MCLKYLLPLGAALALALAGCASPDIQAAWPEPRPLGRDVLAYRPPPSLPAAALPARELTEPTGVLALREALALALLQNPELATFGWEMRTGEARALQAGLPPNPELSLAVENFAGSGALRGFSGTEITIQLSQVIELAGKRLKRARVAALERDLAAWDYEAKRLDVLTQVALAFVEVLSAQEQVALQADLVRLAEQVPATVAERVKAGKVSPVEETRARVALSTSRIALARAQRELEATRKGLAAIWGSTTPTFDKAEGSLEPVTAVPSAEQLTQYITQNPDIARWVTEIVQTQMTKRGGFAFWPGGHHIADFHLAIGDDDTIDEQFNQLSALGKR